jgi:hypothetical protein
MEWHTFATKQTLPDRRCSLESSSGRKIKRGLFCLKSSEGFRLFFGLVVHLGIFWFGNIFVLCCLFVVVGIVVFVFECGLQDGEWFAD